MDFWQIVTMAVSVLFGAISGVILKKVDRVEKKIDKQADNRVSESELTFQGLKAVGHLSEAMARELEDKGAVNGDTKVALEYYNKFTDDLTRYQNRITAEANHGRC